MHDNRHAFATLMMISGVNLKVVGEMLRHSAIATTMNIYPRASLGLQGDAARTLQERLKKYQDPEKATPFELKTK